MDGEAPVTQGHLGNGAAMLAFDVGPDALDDKYKQLLCSSTASASTSAARTSTPGHRPPCRPAT
ncbi:hypothetical protein GCM10020220_040520 [Nonomuraea rubra]